MLAQAAAYSHRLGSEQFAAVGARRYHYALLAALDEFGPSSQAALSRGSGIDRSDVVAVLNELADQGLVERAPDPADRRRNIVTLTAAGRRHLRQLDDVVACIQDALLAPLTPAEREDLVRLLTKLLDHHAQGRIAHLQPDDDGTR